MFFHVISLEKQKCFFSITQPCHFNFYLTLGRHRVKQMYWYHVVNIIGSYILSHEFKWMLWKFRKFLTSTRKYHLRLNKTRSAIFISFFILIWLLSRDRLFTRSFIVRSIIITNPLFIFFLFINSEWIYNGRCYNTRND